MLLLYNLGIHLYYTFVYIVAFFNKKARLWVKGREQVNYAKYVQSIWFHFASLGEFEQGRPVLEQVRALYPQSKIVVTFFSPSGYEIRKNTPLADEVYYLPLDTARNARQFIAAINPTLVIFTKYEYWYHFFNELHKQHIPLYIISGIFRPGQVFFKWYGGLHRKMLSLVSHFFVQDERSKQLLQSINIKNTTVSGDTRFDRVWANAQQPKALPEIEAFTNGQKVFVAGSTWPADEQLLAALVAQYPNWKFIFAPHEISEEKINKLINLLPPNTAIRYSELDKNSKSKIQNSKSADQTLQPTENSKFKIQNSKSADQTLTTQNSKLKIQNCLIIDNIGMLSSLYQYADIAYIGGGFGAGIHNTLEATAFGIPVIFGPNYAKFKEAHDLIALGAGSSVADEEQLKQTVAALINDATYYANASQKAKQYVAAHVGATDTIVKYITEAV